VGVNVSALLAVVALNLATRSAGTRLRSFTSIPVPWPTRGPRGVQAARRPAAAADPGGQR
jgi:hypothetical protein